MLCKHAGTILIGQTVIKALKGIKIDPWREKIKLCTWAHRFGGKEIISDSEQFFSHPCDT